MIPLSQFRINSTINFVTDYGEELVIRRRFDTMFIFTIFDRDGFEIIKLDKQIYFLGDLRGLRMECVYLLKNLMHVYDDDSYMLNMFERFIHEITGE